MSDLRCVLCEAGDCSGHHLTGRDQNGHYLDPDLIVRHCHDHHTHAHDDWSVLGVQDPPEKTKQAAAPPRPLIERVELRLRRLAVFFGRFAETHPESVWFAALARRCKRWADELRAHITAQDGRDPDWRSDPAFYPA